MGKDVNRMNPRIATVRRLFIVMLAALAVGAAACGGDDDGGGAGATSPAATSRAQGPGVISISSTAISGQSGKILLVFATPAGGGAQLARLCLPITSDDFTLSGAVLTDIPAGDDPCGGDTPETTFEEGAYDLVAGVYVGGQQTPEAETTLTGQVAGDTTVEIDGSDLSS
jgi:hypothetical protein